MTTKILVIVILQLMGLKVPHDPACRHTRRAQAVAPVVLRQAADKVDPVLVSAVIMSESSFRHDVTGAHGEVGLMQIKPDGMAMKLCRDLLPRLRDPDVNVACGIRLLASARDTCGPNPLRFLSVYNGTQNCVETPYSRRIVARVAKAAVLVADNR
jgi:soluble lytic murein transglycosylase